MVIVYLGFPCGCPLGVSIRHLDFGAAFYGDDEFAGQKSCGKGTD